MSTFSSFLKKGFFDVHFSVSFLFFQSDQSQVSFFDDKSLHLDDDFLSFIEFVRTFIEIIFLTYTIILYQSNVDIESVELFGSFQNLSKYDVKLVKNLFQFSTLSFLNIPDLYYFDFSFVAAWLFSSFSAKSAVKESKHCTLFCRYCCFKV